MKLTLLLSVVCAKASLLRGQIAAKLSPDDIVDRIEDLVGGGSPPPPNADEIVDAIEDLFKPPAKSESPDFACNFVCLPGFRVVDLDSTGCNGRCEPIVCQQDVKECPGSTFSNPITVSRDPTNDCRFLSCPAPPSCTRDVKACPGWTFDNPVTVSRDPANDCMFRECPEPERFCCRALTVQCLSCSRGQTEAEYCALNPHTSGCPEPEPNCCRALTAECMSCSKGQTVAKYCAQNPSTAGCPVSQPTTQTRFVKVGRGFCRTRNFGKGKADFEPGNGNDYQAFSDITFDECRDICESETPNSSAGKQGYICKGFEYYKKQDKCEIWYKPPVKYARNGGAVCYRAEHEIEK